MEKYERILGKKKNQKNTENWKNEWILKNEKDKEKEKYQVKKVRNRKNERISEKRKSTKVIKKKIEIMKEFWGKKKKEAVQKKLK